MNAPRPRGKILPKISTMPRPKTEAAAYLDIYKLVSEKKRLQQELQRLEERRLQIQERLSSLDQAVTQLETEIPQLRQQTVNVEPAKKSDRLPVPPAPDNFNTMTLEY